MHCNTKRAILKHLSAGESLFHVADYLYFLDSSRVLWRCYDSFYCVPVAFYDSFLSDFVFYY